MAPKTIWSRLSVPMRYLENGTLIDHNRTKKRLSIYYHHLKKDGLCVNELPWKMSRIKTTDIPILDVLCQLGKPKSSEQVYDLISGCIMYGLG